MSYLLRDDAFHFVAPTKTKRSFRRWHVEALMVQAGTGISCRREHTGMLYDTSILVCMIPVYWCG